MVDENGGRAPQNKVMMHTESSGRVGFRWNVAVQEKGAKTEARKKAKIKGMAEQVEQEKERVGGVGQGASFMK